MADLVRKTNKEFTTDDTAALATGTSAGMVSREESTVLSGVTVSGGVGTGATASIGIARSGDVVSLWVDLLTGTSTSASPGTVAAGTVPDWARPSGQIYGQLCAKSFGGNLWNVLVTNIDGSMLMYYLDLDTGTYVVWPASSGMLRMNMTYNVV